MVVSNFFEKAIAEYFLQSKSFMKIVANIGYIGLYQNYHCKLNVFQNMMDSSINRIRVVLAEQNKINRWLAEQMGKSEITISRWVQNKSQPSLE